MLKKLFTLIDKLRFGVVTAKGAATVGDNVTSEINYIDKNGIIVGFWAYGCFDPSMPYPTSKKYNSADLL